MFWKKKLAWYNEHLDENIKALNEGDLKRIPLIYCVFSGEDSNDKLLAAKTLNTVLKSFEFDDIIRMDLQMRQTTSMEWSINWHEQKLDNFFTALMSTEERQTILIFASFNPNGFIRGKAVQKLSEYGGSLPYIILRQNDWVLQVRQAANAAFDKRMASLAKGELLASLQFAEKLKWSNRCSHREYIKKFFDKLISSEHREDLVKGLQSDNLRTRRICVGALFEASQPDIELALNQLKHETEPILRTVIFEKLIKTGQDMKELSRILLSDKYARNRALALKYLDSMQTEDICDISIKLLLDKDIYIRELARNIVKTSIPTFDFRTVYFENIKRFSVPAILGLGEIGQAKDTEIIESYLNDNRIGVVDAALISLMRLDSEKYKTLVTEKLLDSRIGVIKTAQKLCIKHNIANFSRVFEIFIGTPYEYTKIKCMAILFNATKWERLIYMLEALSAEEESVRRLALHSINGWLFSFNRSYVQATEQQKDRIKLLIENQRIKLSTLLVKELTFLLH